MARAPAITHRGAEIIGNDQTGPSSRDQTANRSEAAAPAPEGPSVSGINAAGEGTRSERLRAAEEMAEQIIHQANEEMRRLQQTAGPHLDTAALQVVSMVLEKNHWN